MSTAAEIWFDCWDCPTQCHGDADCDGRVNMTELGMFVARWKMKDPPYEPCLDFNHDLVIDYRDEDIMQRWLNTKPWGPVPPADCPGRYPPVDPLDPVLTLLAPRDGEQILSDSAYTIRWADSPGKGACAGSYLLSYSTDHGETWLPVDANSIDGACSYNWEIPLTPDGGPYSLLIQHADDPDTFDSVEYFHIYDCNETIPGDLNEDCYVDFRDYSIVVSSWATGIDFSAILQLAEKWCDCRNSKDPACGY
ncbi:MAG: hypothetical protein ACYS8Z_11285 [Planctomycetota bacterium]|jgi:hypothetical protein